MFNETKAILAGVEEHMSQAAEKEDIETMGELAEEMRRTLIGVLDAMAVTGTSTEEPSPFGGKNTYLVVDARDVEYIIRKTLRPLGVRPNCEHMTFVGSQTEPPEFCENEVDFGEEYCEEHK